MISGNRSKVWQIVSWATASILVLPIFIMLVSGLSATTELFTHLWNTVLPTYVLNTFYLAIVVGVLSIFFGVISAALITQTNIKAKNILRWLLMLPLAMPAYLVAYLYTDLFDYAGPFQRNLREFFGWESPADYWFFDIRTLFGAGVVISLVLFPYIYMLARTAFEQQDQNLHRASRLLGLTTFQTFYKVCLPLARPAIAIAVSLVLMETLADFATVQYFAVNTLTTAVYDTWLGYGDLSTANALASLLTLMVFFVILFEQKARMKQRHQSNRPTRGNHIIVLSISQQFFASLFCWALAVFGFLLPMFLLVLMALEYATIEQLDVLISTGFNSIELAIYTATIATLIAIVLVLYKRLHQDKYKAVPLNVSGFGYAIPGTVLAMAMLATFGPLDGFINEMAVKLSIEEPGLILSGTIFAIVFALVVRFSAIANGTISGGVEQISQSIDLAPPSLGVKQLKSLFIIHIPLLKSSIFIAWLLVFVEAMKELPAVLLLRPFNFDTLSTQIYQLISDERLEQGAIGAILIVAFGLIPIIWLNKNEDKV
ncbi:iron ABC transporter permease [Colwellia sp. UCD-KL20]|uniref:ABC transporter permease n=1 Tax=Colwellia sp. UCD-KL20 TaxID=1917165 RepID=UPI000970AC44|nr:iron ABC transporter permease [Colwellia sp. UCD-KL20]